MQFGGALPRTKVTEVVDVHAVDHMRDTPLLRHLVEPGKQFVLAVKAAVGIVSNVFRIIKLMSNNVLVADAVLAGEGYRIALVGIGQRRRVRRDRNRVAAQNTVGGPGQVRRISAARIGNDHAAHLLQCGEELAFLLLHTPTVAANRPANRSLPFPE